MYEVCQPGAMDVDWSKEKGIVTIKTTVRRNSNQKKNFIVLKIFILRFWLTEPNFIKLPDFKSTKL
jgi:hypothetical protein